MGLFRRRPVLPSIPNTVAAAIDALAETYAAHAGFTALLLLHHSNAVLALEAAALDPHTADHELAMAAEQAEATREALLTYCTTPEGTR